MISREASENHIRAKVTKGSILRQRPLKIATDKNQAEFTLQGGLAFQPLTFANLSTSEKPQLEIMSPKGWRKVPQSEFYQNDYNPSSKSWEITYSLDLNDPSPKQFRFSVTKSL